MPAPAPAEAPHFVRVGVVDGGRVGVVTAPIEEYVHATVLAEFSPSGGDPGAIARMFEVQAVISRTYAASHMGRHQRQGFDLCATTHCQLYRPASARASPWAASVADAARRTRGIVLWFGSAPAQALFHADCGGHTSAPRDVWGGAAPAYLRPVRDDGPADAAHAAWRFSAGGPALRDAFNADARTTVGNRLDGFQIIERDAAGRAQLVVLQGERQPLVRGEELREVLGRAFGWRSVRSTRFDITREGPAFVFSGRGFGHGVGLCQAGAFARIRAGALPADVLSLYFPGTTLGPHRGGVRGAAF